MPDILHTLPITGKRNKIYRAITEQDGLRSWFTRYAMAESTIGHVNQFGFAGEVKFEMRIDELEPGAHVKWSCLSGHPEWEGTTITFDLEDAPAQKGVTMLRFAHRGWKSTGGFFAHCNYDWAQYLRSLKLYIEKGKGTPS